MWISLYLTQSKYKKIHYYGISSIGLNVLEFFSVPLFTEFLSDLYEKFQVASAYDANVEYKICCFCFLLFLSYADNRHMHIDQPLKIYFSDSEDLIKRKYIKISLWKICPQSSTFSSVLERENKKLKISRVVMASMDPFLMSKREFS